MQLIGLTLETPFVAAPMAGVSSPAFRLMARRHGAGLVYTEMVSAAGLVQRQRRTWGLAEVLPEERPAALQLFGGRPEVMLAAARLASECPVDLIDVNMGCPVKKVRRQSAGSALLEDLPLAVEVMAAAVEGSRLPVTVKLRLGKSRDELDRIVPPLIEAGARAVCLHARTTSQGFGGRADWSAIARLASWCPVPVIGNGDVTSGADAVRMLEETGCAAVMIGRGAMGDPWIFARAVARLAGREPAPPSPAAKRAALAEHVDLARRLSGEGHALHFVRQFMMWYCRGLPGAGDFRRRAGSARELGQLMSLADDYFDYLEAAGA